MYVLKNGCINLCKKLYKSILYLLETAVINKLI